MVNKMPDRLNLHRRQDLRGLALHQEAVRVLRQHPERAERALQVLSRWESTVDPRSKPLFDEWRRIIEGRLWDVAVEDSDRGQQLRQASPLAFVLDEVVRSDILQRFGRGLHDELAQQDTGTLDIVALLGMPDGGDIDFAAPKAGPAGKSPDFS